MEDLTGREYERLTVLEFVEYKNKHSYWKCRCKCGNIHEHVAGRDLKSKHTKSCGCLRKEIAHKRSLKHGDNINNNERHRLYGIWSNLKYRCNCKYKKAKNYKDYAGRGITYDPKWDSYVNFKKEMWHKWVSSCFKFGADVQLSIERKNVNGNYCFQNCIFIPMNEQSLNTRRVKWFKAIDPTGNVYIGRNHTKFSRDNGLNGECVRKCLHGNYSQHKGWKFEFIKLKKIKLKGN